MKTFGKRNYDLNYWKRTGAYAVIQNDHQQFLCVEDSDGNVFLIGGGVEEGETPELALVRESIEETGYKIQVVEIIGKAERHWVSEKYPNDSQHNIGILYVCERLEKVAEPIEEGTMCWIDFKDLEKRLFHEHHSYLIKKYLNNVEVI